VTVETVRESAVDAESGVELVTDGPLIRRGHQ
jgi:hypothetical protein